VKEWLRVPIRQYWLLLRHYLRPQWRPVLLLALLLFSQIGLQLVTPQILRLFIDTAVSSANQSTLTNAAILFLAAGLVGQLLAIAVTYLSQIVAWTATNSLRLDLIFHCLQLDQSFHKQHTPGELIERVDGDVNSLSNFFSQLVVHVAGNALLLAGILILLFWEDWRVGLVLTLFTAAALAILIRVRSATVAPWLQVRQIQAEFYGFVGEKLTGLEDIRANGAKGYVMARFYYFLRRWYPLFRRAWLAALTLRMSTIGLIAVGNALVFALGAYLWRVEGATVGTVYLIFHYTNLLYSPLNQLRNELTDLQQAEASISRIQTLFNHQSALKDGSGGPLPSGPLSVTLQDVSFRYDQEEAVLQHIGLHLEPGRVLGLLGRTGSGKTTLARLLLRLYDVAEGEITLNGRPVREMPLADLRRRVSLVTQDIQLFQATVRDNVTFFNPAVPDAQVTAVLQDLGLTTWLAGLPQGLDTMLASGSSGLSAGQAQLLALGRVFLTNPGLVILDEASSRLDPATEQLMEQALNKLLQGRTAIIIAHRLGTVQRADDILILEDGRVVEQGPRQELAGDSSSHFYHLLQTGLEEVLA
jgi:ABC-type multidrug transport system fused ATPase/permease subunit